MVPWGAPSHLYKGIATLVVALVALQYLFGSVLENGGHIAQLMSSSSTTNVHNLRPKYYRGPTISIERTNYSIIISSLMHRSSSNPNLTILIDTPNPLDAVKPVGQHVTANNLNPNASMSSMKKIEKCPVVPPNLVGPIFVNKSYTPSIAELESELSWLAPGGSFSPTECTAQCVVAVIVPYRGRAEHLLLFLSHMHPFLKKQQIDYAIFVVEQDGNGPFNRGMLMNVGFTEAMKQRTFECFIFHDVDLLPEDDRNLYTCPEQPRHMSVAINVFNYKLPYAYIFGGVSAMTTEQFITVNGFSNSFWGWGAEDDDILHRITYHNYHISRYPVNIARYTMLKHIKEKANPKRFAVLNEGYKRFKIDGLNSLKYNLKKRQLNLLYTWVLADLHAPS